MPIPRHLKHPVALWLIDNRKAMSLKPADVAREIDVTEATVRAWETVRANETKRLPSADNVDAMARLFGNPPPGREPVDAAGELVLALRAQTDAIASLVEEMRLAREEQGRWNDGVEEALVRLGAQVREEPKGDREPVHPNGDRGDPVR